MNLTSTDRIEQTGAQPWAQEESVCAWCCCEYDVKSGIPVRALTDAEYDTIITHGCCKICAEREIARFFADRQLQPAGC